MSLKDSIESRKMVEERIIENSEHSSEPWTKAVYNLEVLEWVENELKKEKPPLKKLTEEISNAAEAMEAINVSGFTRKMLVLYIQDKTKMGKQKIEQILDLIEEFSKEIKTENNSEYVQ